MTRLTPNDLSRQVAIGQLDIAPAGDLIVYTRREVCADRDRVNLWLVDTAGGPERRLTDGPHWDVRPRFSPDGAHIAFVSDRGDGATQLHVVPTAGGPAQQISGFPRGLAPWGSEIDWHPSGHSIVVCAHDDVSRFRVGDGDDGPTARVITRIDWRIDGLGFREFPTHVHVVPFSGTEATSEPSRRLTEGEWSASRPRWSPDGSRVAYLADTRYDGSDVAPHTAVWSVAVAGGKPRRETSLSDSVTRFSFAPDGALLCIADGDSPAGYTAFRSPRTLWRVTPDSTTKLSGGLDRFVGEAVLYTDLVDWMTTFDDAGVLTTVADAGRTVPYSFEAAEPRPLVDPARGPMTHSIVRAGGTIAATMSVDGTPAEVYVLEDSGPRALTRSGGEWLADFDSVAMHEFEIDGPAGAIQTFLFLPPGDREPPYPLILNVHGGPVDSWGPTPPLETLLPVHAGYAVVMPNIRGSHNRGQAWAAALEDDWGACLEEDCHAVLDALVDRGIAHPGRIGCMGLSFGGFAVNWLVGTSDRFAAAVTENGITNQVSFAGSSSVGLVLYPPGSRFDATTEDGRQELWRRSPLRNVEAITTPLLILQAADDLRCPVSESEQLFVSLRVLGRPAEYVLYPDESHEFQGAGRFDRRVDRHQRVLDWFARHMPADDC